MRKKGRGARGLGMPRCREQGSRLVVAAQQRRRAGDVAPIGATVTTSPYADERHTNLGVVGAVQWSTGFKGTAGRAVPRMAGLRSHALLTRLI